MNKIDGRLTYNHQEGCADTSKGEIHPFCHSLKSDNENIKVKLISKVVKQHRGKAFIDIQRNISHYYT